MNNAQHLELDDRLRFTLTGEKCRVVEVHHYPIKARDIEAIFQSLVDDNYRRFHRGLPTFEPSYELAEKALRNQQSGPRAITLRWPSGDRIAYATSDGIWQHFIKQY